MEFDLKKSEEILERTPFVLDAMLGGIDETWINGNEGGESWSPYYVMGHLIHGERTDWIPRVEIILADREDKRFIPFDRFAQLRNNRQNTLSQLLAEFALLRKDGLDTLRSKKISVKDLEKKGIHPEFGEVTLAELLAAWTVHDLGHIAQIARVMAKQYNQAVGPWTTYLTILSK
jgi:DinB superfamily